MSATLACYGRLGAQTQDKSRVSELLKRSVEGQYQATAAFKATLAEALSEGHALWEGPIGNLTVLFHQWLTLVAWERATVALDAAIAEDSELSDVSYRLVASMCDAANESSMNSIRVQTEAKQGKRPGNVTPITLTMIGGTNSTTLVWAALESIYTRVRADLTYVAKLGIPPRMRKVYQEILREYEPIAEQFSHLVLQWRSTSSADAQTRLIRQAVPLAQKLYGFGQQIWTPYLIGQLYIDIVRSMPMFAKLNLPFDPWILTDPKEVERRVTDQESCQQLITFWQTVTDPLAAKTLQDSIVEALESESIMIESSGTLRVAPWLPRYRVLHEVAVLQQQLNVGQVFMVYPATVQGKRSLEIRVVG